MSQEVEQMLNNIVTGQNEVATEQFNKIISQRALAAIENMKPEVGANLFGESKEK